MEAIVEPNLVPNMEPNKEPNFIGSQLLEPNLVELLNHALGSGESAGACNFITLKTILESILQKLNLSAEPAKQSPRSESNYYDVKNRIENLERVIEENSRPRSPSTLISESQNGKDSIRNDWEVTKLRKRVDANEEGVNKALAILDRLVTQIQDVKNDVEETKERLKIEQQAQDEAIAKNESLIKEMTGKITQLSEVRTNPIEQTAQTTPSGPSGPSDDFYAKLQEHDRRLRLHDSELRNCVNWDQLNRSFMIDFFNETGEDNCENERKAYSYYFNGLQTLSELGTKIDEMLRDGDTATDSLASIRSQHATSEHSSMRVLETYTLGDVDTKDRRTVIIAEQTTTVKGVMSSETMGVDDLLKENDQLRFDLERIKAGAGPGRSSRGARMSIFSRKSIAAEGAIPSLCGLDDRLRDCEVFSETAQNSIDEHDQALEEHFEQITNLLKLKGALDTIYTDMGILNRFMESYGQRAGDDEESSEGIEKLQKKLSGTERELSRLADLMAGLSSEGDQKNRELDELQSLLRDLQDRAAMRDTVMDDLAKKANTEDLEGMLGRDDLDATAQAIINQLQGVIESQAATEAQLQSSIDQVGAEMESRATKDEFDPFKSDIEGRLRLLRKKIESSKKEQNGLTTAEGAAGFRRQLFNCISCNNNLNLTAMRPILPEPSAFPARLSLRPHFGQAPAHHFFYSKLVAESRSRPKSAFASPDGEDNSQPADGPREHTSHYATLLAEREGERRRKQIENKIRQECNPYNFQSGIFPRQVGGPPQKLPEPFSVEKDKEERYERLRRSKSLSLELEADLEGTDGHLYKGRIKKLPSLKRKSKEKGGKRSPDPALKISNTLNNNDT